MGLVCVHVVHLYSSIDTATVWKKFYFILSDGSDFHIIDAKSIPFHAFAWRIVISLSVDEILLPKYVKLSTNFRRLSLRAEIALSRLKHMFSILIAFTLNLPAVCSRLRSLDSASAGVFAGSSISYAKSTSVIVSSVYCLFLVFCFWWGRF